MEVTNNKMQALIEAILNEEDRKADITANIKVLYEEAKAEGFNVKIMRKIVSEAKKDVDVRTEEKELFDIYYDSVFGM